MSRFEAILKANPYHDARGRFASAHGAAHVSAWANAAQLAAASYKPAPMFVGEYGGNPTQEFFDLEVRALGDIEKLSGDQKDGIRAYTGSTYRDINDNLRDPSMFVGAAKANLDKKAQKLQDVLKAHTLGADIMLYRGVSQRTLERMGKPKIGMIVEDKAFGSSSVRKSVADGWKDGNHVLSIRGRSNTPGLYVDSISKAKGEKEFLLPHSTKLMIVGVKKPVFSKEGYLREKGEIFLEVVGP